MASSITQMQFWIDDVYFTTRVMTPEQIIQVDAWLRAHPDASIPERLAWMHDLLTVEQFNEWYLLMTRAR